MTTRTHVILDGLQDPLVAQALSAHWARVGFRNGVDVAGQAAWIAPHDACASSGVVLTEADLQNAAAVARGHGLVIRDRVGNSFRGDNDLASMRHHLAYEYKSRFATAVVFGLPALGLHWGGGVLAGGAEGSGGARWMLYPWLFEMLLVGWVIVAAGWPVLCQGLVSLVHLRATPDLLTTVVVVVAWVPSAAGVLSMLVVDRPWFISSLGTGGPAFHAALIAITLAVLQRWWLFRCVASLGGRANWMLRGVNRLVVVWMLVAAVVCATGGWWRGLAFGLLMPPLISSGAINPWSPGRSILLPVFGFAVVFLAGPGALALSLDGLEVEAAGGFCFVMTVFFALGWRRIGRG